MAPFSTPVDVVAGTMWLLMFFLNANDGQRLLQPAYSNEEFEDTVDDLVHYIKRLYP